MKSASGTPAEPARTAPTVPAGRPTLRARLRAKRDAFVASAAFAAADSALAGALREALVPIEPGCLGLYWPLRSEFNAAAALAADARFDKIELALPYARRTPRALEFRRWDGSAPSRVDECGIGTGAGAAVQPDVVVVPCLGFTADGHRLGYGGGYYDRWLAAHGDVVAIGVAWSWAELDLATFAAESHDVPLALIVTELGVR